MKSKNKKQNTTSNAVSPGKVLPGEFLDKLMLAYPEEYETAYGISKNVIISIAREAEKMKPFSFEEYCYWFFILDYADRYIKHFQDLGIVDYRRQLHHTRRGVKKFDVPL